MSSDYDRQRELERVIGPADSTTRALLAMRQRPGDGPLVPGVWYSDFSRVIGEAAKLGVPFFALWTNGCQCTYCRRMAGHLTTPEFLRFMQASYGLWWLGCASDDSREDCRGGVGFTWCLGPDERVGIFPLFAVKHFAAGMKDREFFGSGPDYDRGNDAPVGTRLVIEKITDVIGVGKPKAKAVQAKQDTCASGRLHIRFNPKWDAAKILRFQSAMKSSGGHCLSQDQSPDTMCMCKAFMGQTKPGPCRCGAFEKYKV